jgi:hypothetical protein
MEIYSYRVRPIYSETLPIFTRNRALDFLYLDYKVPHPLQALIPTAVLSKYQRIFALLLRLMRGESAGISMLNG